MSEEKFNAVKFFAEISGELCGQYQEADAMRAVAERKLRIATGCLKFIRKSVEDKKDIESKQIVETITDHLVQILEVRP